MCHILWKYLQSATTSPYPQSVFPASAMIISLLNCPLLTGLPASTPTWLIAPYVAARGTFLERTSGHTSSVNFFTMGHRPARTLSPPLQSLSPHSVLATGLFAIPQTHQACLPPWAFALAVPSAWNSFPLGICSTCSLFGPLLK